MEFNKNNKPSILNIAPNDGGGLIQEEMVPEGELADYDIIMDNFIEMGFPPRMIEDFREKIKTDPKLRKKMDGKRNAMSEHLKKNPDKYGDQLEGLEGGY